MPEKKKRCISGEAYWKLDGLTKKVEKAVDALDEERERLAKKYRVFKRQVHHVLGAIVDPLEGEKIVKELTLAEAEKLQKLHKDVRTSNRAVDNEINSLAKQLGVRPHLIDYKTGDIAGDEAEVLEPKKDQPAEETKPAQPAPMKPKRSRKK